MADFGASPGSRASGRLPTHIAVANAGIAIARDRRFLYQHSLAPIASNTMLGSITGGTPIALTAAQIRTLAGLAIGTNVQAWDADLDALAALSGTNTIYYRSASNTWSAVTIGTGLGFSAGTLSVTDAELAALAGLVSAADRLPYFTGSGTAALAVFTNFARTLVDDADAATARSTLGVIIGTNVQAQSGELQAIANLTSAADTLPYYTAADVAALATFTAFARTLLDDADATTARSTLGLTIGSNVQAFDADLTALAALSGTNTIYYRSAVNTWTAVTIDPSLSFSAGTLKRAVPKTTHTSGALSISTAGRYFVAPSPLAAITATIAQGIEDDVTVVAAFNEANSYPVRVLIGGAGGKINGAAAGSGDGAAAGLWLAQPWRAATLSSMTAANYVVIGAV